jgi:hypothetical protein
MQSRISIKFPILLIIIDLEPIRALLTRFEGGLRRWAAMARKLFVMWYL